MATAPQFSIQRWRIKHRPFSIFVAASFLLAVIFTFAEYLQYGDGLLSAAKNQISLFIFVVTPVLSMRLHNVGKSVWRALIPYFVVITATGIVFALAIGAIGGGTPPAAYLAAFYAFGAITILCLIALVLLLIHTIINGSDADQKHHEVHP